MIQINRFQFSYFRTKTSLIRFVSVFLTTAHGTVTFSFSCYRCLWAVQCHQREMGSKRQNKRLSNDALQKGSSLFLRSPLSESIFYLHIPSPPPPISKSGPHHILNPSVQQFDMMGLWCPAVKWWPSLPF